MSPLIQQERRFDNNEKKKLCSQSSSIHYYHFISPNHYDSSNKKPIIGIVSSKERIPKGSFQKDVHIVNLDYINMDMKMMLINLILELNEL